MEPRELCVTPSSAAGTLYHTSASGKTPEKSSNSRARGWAMDNSRAMPQLSTRSQRSVSGKSWLQKTLKSEVLNWALWGPPFLTNALWGEALKGGEGNGLRRGLEATAAPDVLKGCPVPFLPAPSSSFQALPQLPHQGPEALHRGPRGLPWTQPWPRRKNCTRSSLWATGSLAYSGPSRPKSRAPGRQLCGDGRQQ